MNLKNDYIGIIVILFILYPFFDKFKSGLICKRKNFMKSKEKITPNLNN